MGPGKYSIYPFLFPLPFLVACTGEFNLADCTEACEVNQGQMTGTGTHMRSSFPCRDEDGRGTIQDTCKYKKPRGLFSCVIISLRSSRAQVPAARCVSIAHSRARNVWP